MRRICLIGPAAMLAFGAAAAEAQDCTEQLRAVVAEAPDLGAMPADQRLLARDTLRDLRAAAHRLDTDGLEAACLATVEALTKVMTEYYLAMDDPAPAGEVLGAEDQTGRQAVVDRRDPRLVPLTAAELALDTRDLIGNTVYSYRGTLLGEFAGLLTGAGGIATHVLIDDGGFWDIGPSEVAVPVELVRWDPQRAQFYLPLTGEQLDGAPDYDGPGGEWQAAANDQYFAELD